MHTLLSLQTVGVPDTQAPAPSQVLAAAHTLATVQTTHAAAKLIPQTFALQVRVWHEESTPGQSPATVHCPVTLIVAVAASPPSAAVIVALAAPAATLLALKEACVAPATTVTLGGTVTAAEVEESVTGVPAMEGAAKVTVRVAELKAVRALAAGLSVIPGLVTVTV